tara:strand:+ start:1585 stop:2136 length:552 start_codon:yes stop_codon:yes gene_type:complete
MHYTKAQSVYGKALFAWQSLDSIFSQMNISTQHLIDNLQEDDSLLNTVTNNLFNYLEKRSLFKASAYLSVTLLNDHQSNLNDDLAAKLESYRKLKVGTIAPDIALQNTTKRSALKIRKLMIFGASRCPTCKKDTTELLKQYTRWEAKNIAIIYNSIDTDKTAFETAYKEMPWQTYCDYKGWKT